MTKRIFTYVIGFLVAVLSFGSFLAVAEAATLVIKGAKFTNTQADIEIVPSFDKKEGIALSITIKDAAGTIIGDYPPSVINTENNVSKNIPIKNITVDLATVSKVTVDAQMVRDGKILAKASKVLSPTSSITISKAGQTLLEQNRKLDPTFRITEVNGEKKATVSWRRVAGAVSYKVARGDGASTDEFITVQENTSTNSTIDLDITNDSVLGGENLKPSDTFTVEATGADGKRIVSEQTSNPDVVTAPTEFGQIANIGQYANKIMQYALPLGVALAILVSIYAGITMMISQGEPDKIKSAQEGIQGAVIGLVVLLLTRLLADFLYIPGLEFPGAVAQQQLERSQAVTIANGGAASNTSGTNSADAPAGPGVMLNVPGVGEGRKTQCGNASVSMAILFGNPTTNIPLGSSPFVIKKASAWTQEWPAHVGKQLGFYSQRNPWPYTNPAQSAMCPTVSLLNKYYPTAANGNRGGWNWYNDKSFDSVIRSLRGVKKDGTTCANPLVNGKCVGDPVVGYFKPGSMVSNSKHIVTIVGYDPTKNPQQGGTFYINNPLPGGTTGRVIMQAGTTMSGQALTKTLMEASAGVSYNHTYALRSVYR